jgi:hypothetical protein
MQVVCVRYKKHTYRIVLCVELEGKIPLGEPELRW